MTPMTYLPNIPSPWCPDSGAWRSTSGWPATAGVIRPLDPEAVKVVLQSLLDQGHRGPLAVCLINSYENPDHEMAIRDLVVREAPGLFLSTSFAVLPQIREYERTCTTVTNAYVQPITDRYLEKLSSPAAVAGIRRTVVYHAFLRGGITSVDTARKFPVRIIESGPTAAVIASQHYGRHVRYQGYLLLRYGRPPLPNPV